MINSPQTRHHPSYNLLWKTQLLALSRHLYLIVYSVIICSYVSFSSRFRDSMLLRIPTGWEHTKLYRFFLSLFHPLAPISHQEHQRRLPVLVRPGVYGTVISLLPHQRGKRLKTTSLSIVSNQCKALTSATRLRLVFLSG